MAIATLTAHTRNNKVNKVRKEGCIPAIVYGFGHEEGSSVQFNASELMAEIRKYGSNARVSVTIDGKDEYGAIKDVQRHPVTGEVRHIDIQVFSKEDVVKLTVPIIFNGAEDLAVKRIVVGTLLTEIEITGPAMDIPQSITVDLSERLAGDVVTVADLGVSEDLRLSAELTDALVTLTEATEEPEEVEEVEVTEPEVIEESTEE